MRSQDTEGIEKLKSLKIISTHFMENSQEVSRNFPKTEIPNSISISIISYNFQKVCQNIFEKAIRVRNLAVQGIEPPGGNK